MAAVSSGPERGPQDVVNKRVAYQCCESRCAYAAAAPRSQILHRDRSARAALETRCSRTQRAHKTMADRDDAMDVGAIEDDALNDDDEQDENGDEVEEGYKMV